MKRILLFVLCLTALGCLVITPAQAHYVYLEPQDQVSATVGEELTVAAYLHADTNDKIYGWGFSEVFDTTELSRLSFAWGSSAVGNQGVDAYTPVEDYWDVNFTFLSRLILTGVALTAGSDYQLFTVTYSFMGGAFNGSDAWIDWKLGEDVFWDFDSGYVNSLPIQGSGPDYGSNAVPIPGAVWLLGSGVVALVGLKRRASR